METGALMVEALNDGNNGLLRIEETWLYHAEADYNRTQTAMISP
jgi:hypothetical protein